MTVEESASEKSIFLAALELPPAEWPPYLDGACGGDVILRARVEMLLRGHAETSGPVDRLQPPPVPAADSAGRDGALGTVIGPYKLLEAIGEGGMGTVYMAEQAEPVRRRVALKVIKPGMDSKQVVARFEAERQALALMDHPNIARVLDGGTTASGRPFFVMELVRGIPITEYCDRERMTVPERLELFVGVCRAVQHAHQKGVIHRDLKPSNVLVTTIDGRAVPKVIDFGIAKATGASLTDKTLFTGFAQLVGTPLYMSPEQADVTGADVDTRSDVYSLGVLLYELLTGSTPFESEALRRAAFDEMRRIIREDDPPRPSTRLSSLGQTLTTVSANRKSDPTRLGRSLRGELDWVVMKALEKDRRRRYESAGEFAADVTNYLADQPVAACPPSASYRFSKFARRNRVALATGLAIGLTLIACSAVSTWLAVRAIRAEHQAEGRSVQARRAVDEMYTQVAEKWLAQQPKMTAVQREFLEKALTFYRQFAAEGGNDLQTRLNVARARKRVAAIEKTLGRLDRAEDGYRLLLADLEDLTAQYPGDMGSRDELGSTLASLGEVARFRNRFKEAESFGERSAGVYESLCTQSPKSNEYRDRLAGVLHDLASVYSDQGRHVEAESSHRRARDILATLHEKSPHNAHLTERLAYAEDGLGRAWKALGRHPDAVQALRHSVQLREEVLAVDGGNPNHRFNLAVGLLNLSAVIGDASEETLNNDRKCREIALQLVAEFPDRPRYRELLGVINSNYVRALHYLGRPGEAEEVSRSACVSAEELAAEFPTIPDHRRNLALCLDALGHVLLRAGRPDEAEGPIRRSREILESLVKENPTQAEYRRDLEDRCDSGAHHIAGLADPTPGRAAWALDWAQRAVELDPKNQLHYQALGWARYRAGDWKGCIEALEKQDSYSRDGDFFAAMAQWRLGDESKARELFRRADDDLADYEKRWKPGKYPAPPTLKRIRAEAAKLLGIGSGGTEKPTGE